jgi:hypothetical protein
MRDFAELVKALRYCGECDRQGCAEECKYGKEHPLNYQCIGFLFADAADAIEELLSVCREIAAFVMHYSDEGEVSAEVLCRKLHKIGVIEKDGAWWTLPEPPKGVE